MIAAAAIVGALAVPAALSLTSGTAQGGPAAQPDYQFEKCYGVVKAGQNDCQTATSSCAGTSKTDMQPDAWVYLPAGTCAKIAGGSTEPKA
jgi:uncharacterized membrane protein